MGATLSAENIERQSGSGPLSPIGMAWKRFNPLTNHGSPFSPPLRQNGGGKRALIERPRGDIITHGDSHLLRSRLSYHSIESLFYCALQRNNFYCEFFSRTFLYYNPLIIIINKMEPIAVSPPSYDALYQNSPKRISKPSTSVPRLVVTSGGTRLMPK